jgi:hypothetical protein
MVIQQGCEDCELVTDHRTRTQALRACLWHVTELKGHRPLIADNNGWHRVWLEDEEVSLVE